MKGMTWNVTRLYTRTPGTPVGPMPIAAPESPFPAGCRAALIRRIRAARSSTSTRPSGGGPEGEKVVVALASRGLVRGQWRSEDGEPDEHHRGQRACEGHPGGHAGAAGARCAG